MSKRRTKNSEPDFHLKMKSRDRGSTSAARVGAGWINSKGGINIKLHMGVVLDHRDDEDFILTLWPNNHLAEAMMNSFVEEVDE